MREHVRTRRDAEEVLVVVGLRVLAVVVGILEHTVPPLQRAVRAQHRLALRAVVDRVGMVVLADRVGLARHTLARKAEDAAAAHVHHRLVADRPVLVHARMAPVGVVVHVVHLRLQVRRRVAELRGGDGRLEAQLLLEVVAHARPVGVLRVAEELVEVARQRLAARPEREVVDLVRSLAEARELDLGLLHRVAGIERERVFGPFRRRLEAREDAERRPALAPVRDGEAHLARRPLHAPDAERHRVGRVLLHDDAAVELGEELVALPRHGHAQRALDGADLRLRASLVEDPRLAVHHAVELPLGDHLVAERLHLLLPRRLHLLVAAVLLQEPVVPLVAEHGGVWLAEAVHRAVQVLAPERVLVVELHHGHHGVLEVAHPRVGVHVREQFARVLLLHLDDARVELVRALVHVHVDAALLELRDQVVLAVAPLGVELPPRAEVLREDALLVREHERAVGAVEVMEAHAVDAEAGETRGEALRLLVGGEVGGAGEVRRVQAHAPLIVDEVSVLHADAPVLPGGHVQQVAHVHHVLRRVVRRHEREHPVVRRPRHSGRQDRHRHHRCFHVESPLLSKDNCRAAED